MFGGELSADAQAWWRKCHIHSRRRTPLLLSSSALFNNSVGALDMADGSQNVAEFLEPAENSIRAMYVAEVSPEHLHDAAGGLGKTRLLSRALRNRDYWLLPM